MTLLTHSVLLTLQSVARPPSEVFYKSDLSGWSSTILSERLPCSQESAQKSHALTWSQIANFDAARSGVVGFEGSTLNAFLIDLERG